MAKHSNEYWQKYVAKLLKRIAELEAKLKQARKSLRGE